MPGDIQSTTAEAGTRERTRIGVVLPSVNTVIEPFFAAAVPPDVSVHAHRMPIGPVADAAAAADMDTHARETLTVLATCRPAAILYACTASGLLRGREHDLATIREFTDLTGVPCAGAADAVVRALRVLGAERVSVASPYVERIDEAEVAYLEASGLRVLGRRSLGVTGTHALAGITPDTIADLARRAFVPGSDALVIACLNLRSHEVDIALSGELGRPVVSATRAGLWHTLHLAGVPTPMLPEVAA